MSTTFLRHSLPLNTLQDSSKINLSSQRFKLFSVPNSITKTRAEASTFRKSNGTVVYNSEVKIPFGNFVTIEKRNSLGEDDILSLLKLSDDLCDCRQIHGRLIKLDSLGRDSFVANRLVVMYSKNEGLMEDARKMFDRIPERRVQSYAAMIRSFCRLEKWDELFCVLKLMISDGMLPDKYMVPTLLKACSVKELLLYGKIVHGYVVRRGFECDLFVGNGLIDFYANCGDLGYCRGVFDAMSERDVVSWTALVSGYMDLGLLDEAVDVFRTMQLNGVRPDLISWNALAAGYAKNGELVLALDCLDNMREKGLTPKVNSWNGVISACVHNEHFEDALEVFRAMLQTPEKPNIVTIVSVLQACAGLNELALGRALHALSLRRMLNEHLYFEGSLIDMYSKCGKVNHAVNVFNKVNGKNIAIWNEIIAAQVNAGKMEDALELFNLIEKGNIKPDVITFNTILAGYARRGRKTEALKLLSKMVEMDVKLNIVSCNVLLSGFQQYGFSLETLKLLREMQSPESHFLPDDFTIQPNSVTLTSSLAACADLSLHQKGKEIHGYILKHLFDSNIYILSSLVDMYAKCNNMESATKVFTRTEDKNTVLWNVLIAGLIKNKQPDQAILRFVKMLEEDQQPSSVTFMTLLLASADFGLLRIGKALHSYTLKGQHDNSTPAISSALIDLYSKCGYVFESRKVFDLATEKDVALWNSMISAYTTHGLSSEAMALHKDMETNGPSPDRITLMPLLTACARDGLVEEGWRYFLSMDKYGIQPSIELFTRMVAILGSAGLLNEAFDFISKMPFEPDARLWSTLLQACRVHSNPEIGERAAGALRNVIKGRKVMTVKECSSVTVGSAVHNFHAGNLSDFRLDEVLRMWDTLATEMEETGYVPNDLVMEAEDELDPFSCAHTEKLAICYGIVISNGFRQPIRVSKNTRMCIDCHTCGKIISRIQKRDIYVNDPGFYHHFKDGKCSCQDRW